MHFGAHHENLNEDRPTLSAANKCCIFEICTIKKSKVEVTRSQKVQAQNMLQLMNGQLRDLKRDGTVVPIPHIENLCRS